LGGILWSESFSVAPPGLKEVREELLTGGLRRPATDWRPFGAFYEGKVKMGVREGWIVVGLFW